MTYIKRKEIDVIVGTAKGRIFGVTFTKKDGSLRDMVCRRGVKSKLRGGESTVKYHPEYITVYDMAKNGYRNVNKNTIKSLRINGREFIVKG